jgi:Leucine-rich repeat (LRR) protein
LSGNRIATIASIEDVDKWLIRNPEWINYNTFKQINKLPIYDSKDILCDNSGFISVTSNRPNDIASKLPHPLHEAITAASRGDQGQFAIRMAAFVYSFSRLIITTFPPIENLAFSSNRLSSFPTLFLFFSPTIKTLNFSHNRINSVPKTLFAYFSKLTRVDFSYNHITLIPSSFINFSRKAVAVDFAHNSLRTLPQLQIIEQNTPTLFPDPNKPKIVNVIYM